MPKALTTPPGLQKKNKSQKKDPSNQLNLGPPHSRDLAIQDFSLVLVPGNRLGCLSARPARSVRRCARTRICGQRRIAPLMHYAGAGIRLSCLARARRERAALRAHPSLWAASHCSAHALRGSGVCD